MPARDFSELIALLRRAEALLAEKAGQTEPGLRITTLRGIYYGTPWSQDYKAEGDPSRNFMFFAYCGGALPADPRPALGERLFTELQSSQDVRDKGGQLDIGHALIGLDAGHSDEGISSERALCRPLVDGRHMRIPIMDQPVAKGDAQADPLLARGTYEVLD